MINQPPDFYPRHICHGDLALELSPVPSLIPLSTSTFSLLASGYFPFSLSLDAGDSDVGFTGGIGTEVELFSSGPLVHTPFHQRRDLRAIIRAKFHHRGILRLIWCQLTAMIEMSATRYVIKDTTTVVTLYSRVVWSISFWNIVIPNTVWEAVREQFNSRRRAWLNLQIRNLEADKEQLPPWK